MDKDRFDNIVKYLEHMAEQFIRMVESNNDLLVENLRLMKEVKRLEDEIEKTRKKRREK